MSVGDETSRGFAEQLGEVVDTDQEADHEGADVRGLGVGRQIGGDNMSAEGGHKAG